MFSLVCKSDSLIINFANTRTMCVIVMNTSSINAPSVVRRKEIIAHVRTLLPDSYFESLYDNNKNVMCLVLAHKYM